MFSSSSTAGSRLVFKIKNGDVIEESGEVAGWSDIKPKSLFDVEVAEDHVYKSLVVGKLEEKDYVFVRPPTPAPAPPPMAGWSTAALIWAALLGVACGKLFEPTVDFIPFTATMFVAAMAALLLRCSPKAAELASTAVAEAIAERLVGAVAVSMEWPVVTAWAAVRNHLPPNAWIGRRRN